jgi:hypothetical protein
MLVGMRTRPGRSLASAALALVLLSGCNDDGDQTAPRTASPSDSTAGTTTTDRSGTGGGTSSTPGGEHGAAAPDGAGNEDARSFKEMAPTATPLGPEIQAFVATASEARIDELAADSCAAVRPAMTDRELGVSAFDTYDLLVPAEQEALALDDWMVLYGAMLGFFCPANLPEAVLEPGALASGDDIDGYRALIADYEGISADAGAFVAALGDDRIDELRRIACAATTAETTSEAFGLAIVESYSADLTDGEREDLSLNAYSELYGGMVGWFCPDRLPR